MAYKFSDSKSIGDSGNAKKKRYEYNRLFKRGCNLSCCLYFLSILFFSAWIIGHSRESLLVKDSSAFSRFFFFLNPNLFNEIVFKGNALTWMSGAVNLNSFTFLVCYLIALISFVIMVCCAVWLFLISYHTSLKFFHYVSCLSVFPIISCFPLTWFMLKLFIYKLGQKRGKTTKFDVDFEPEKFDEPQFVFDDKYLASRPVTTPFDYAHYRSHYKKTKMQDSIKDWHRSLSEYLS